MNPDFARQPRSLSVIIPACNEEEYLPSCLDFLNRLRAETFDLEIVVVDNGSTDHTARIAREKGAVVVDSSATTIAGVRNDGAAAAGGEFLAFLDADCTVEPGWAATIVEDLREEGVVAVGSYPIVPETGSTWVQKTWSHLLRSVGGKNRARWLPSANMAVLAESFKKLTGFNEELHTCEDADLSYRLATLGEVVDDPRMLVVHHREPATLREFFWKEIWHGKDSYRRMWRGGLVAEELPSLLIPLISLTGCLMILAGLAGVVFSRGGHLVILGTIGILLPPLGLTGRAFRRGSSPPAGWIAVFCIYSCYVLARTWALILGLLPARQSGAGRGNQGVR